MIRWTLSIYGRPRSSWLLRRWRGWRSIEGSGRRRESAITRLGSCCAAARSTAPCPGDTYTAPYHGWTCFHCGQTFVRMDAAREVESALTLRLLFHLPLRQAEGVLRSLCVLMGLDLRAPDHTTLSAPWPVPRTLATAKARGLHLIIDSS